MSSALPTVAVALLILLLSNSCHGAPTEWDYETNDPSKWPTSFKKWCGGRMQSPVKLAFSEATYDTDLPAYQLTEPNLSGLKYQAYNDGHKVTVLFSSVMPNVTVPGHPGSCFRPVSVHWHWGPDDSQGSEHWLDGRHYPLEGHVVMWNCQLYADFAEALDGFSGLAVLSVMYESDASSPGVSAGLGRLIGMLPNPLLTQCAGCKNNSFEPPLVDMDAFSITDVLPSDMSQYYLYSGSLTTPDCRENVMWTVYRQSVRVPPSVLAAFRSLKYPDGTAMVSNFRPPLSLNPSDPFGPRRTVVRSFSTAVASSLPSDASWHRASHTGATAAVLTVAAAYLMTPLR